MSGTKLTRTQKPHVGVGWAGAGSSFRLHLMCQGLQGDGIGQILVVKCLEGRSEIVQKENVYYC